MQRIVDSFYRETIGLALDLLSEPLLNRVRFADFLTGTPPKWAGLHNSEELVAEYAGLTTLGFADLPHCCYPWHTSDLSTTIVLPKHDVQLHEVVHEIGHVLDFTMGFAHEAQPITEYAKTNRMEAFAESFVGLYFWYGDQDVFMKDEATRALFASLS